MNTSGAGLQNIPALDQKLLAAETLSNLNTEDDISTDFRSGFVDSLNNLQASEVIIEIEPIVALAAMPAPADRKGLLDRTSTSSTSVNVTFTNDDYFKVGVDKFNVKPEETATKFGKAGAKALIKRGNSVLTAAIVGAGTVLNGNVSYLGSTFSEATTGATIWGKLVGMIADLQEDEVEEDFAVYVTPKVWASLIVNVVALTSSVDPRTTAASLLGIKKLRVRPMTGALATVAHRGSVVLARVVADSEYDKEDFDLIVRGRVKTGPKVLDVNAIRVLKDGTQPA